MAHLMKFAARRLVDPRDWVRCPLDVEQVGGIRLDEVSQQVGASAFGRSYARVELEARVRDEDVTSERHFVDPSRAALVDYEYSHRQILREVPCPRI